MTSFIDLGLLTSLVKTLKSKRHFNPTEIQANVIPLMMGGQSVVGVSETGSGKTLAYALPILHALKTMETEGNPVTEPNSPRAIVLVPSRELADQVSKVFKSLTHDTRLRVRPALGGMAMADTRKNIAGPFEILLATPGRLVQLIEGEMINLSDVRTLVFDEADQMMDQGFLPNSSFVVDSCPKELQLALFSATVSPTVQELMNELFVSAEVIRSEGSGKLVKTLTTTNLKVEDGKRWPLFEMLIKQRVEGGTMVFANTREQCDKIAQELTSKGYECVIYRGEMEKADRRDNLKKFRDGKVSLLIATDLAGRGLDIPHVGRVINYHLPKQMENYVHRAGRTARAGRKGTVVNLVTERDIQLISKLEGVKQVTFEKRQKPAPSKQSAGKPKPKQAQGKPPATGGKPKAKSAPQKSAKPKHKSFSGKSKRP